MSSLPGSRCGAAPIHAFRTHGNGTRAHNVLVELQRLASLAETPDSLDAHLDELTRAAVRMLEAEQCAIILLSDDAPADVEAASSPTPPCAVRDESVFRRTVAAPPSGAGPGAPASCATGQRPSRNAAAAVLCAPIRRNGRTIGVIRVSGPRGKAGFDLEDRWLLDVVTVYIGKSLHTVQLQNILQSRFAQIALAHSVDNAVGKMLATVPHPRRMVKILAKSFYGEMKKAGFGAREIISAASEIIDELSASLKRHARGHGGGNEPADE